MSTDADRRARELVAALAGQAVTVRADGDRLRVEGAVRSVRPEQLVALRELKSTILAAIADDLVVIDGLRAVFARVLDRPEVTGADNFFELGGTSLTIAKIVSRVRERFGVTPSFSQVFDNPTPARLSAVIRELGRGGQGLDAGVHRAAQPHQSPPTFAARPRLADLPASPQQERYFLSYGVEVAGSGRMSVLLDEWDDPEALAAAVRHLVDRHEILRTGFHRTPAGALRQRIHPTAAVPAETVMLTAPGNAGRRAELDGLVRDHTFDLGRPPLLRLLVHRPPQGPALAALGVFSGVLDAYSEGTLARELRAVYDLARAGRLADRPPLRFQYQDFSQWQHEVAASPAFDVAREFWQRRYPTDYRGFHLPDDGRERTGAMRIFLLGEDLSSEVRHAAAACESSVFGYLLAGLARRAADLYGRTDVSMGVLYHGRDVEELQDQPGYFVDLFCLRCDVDSDEPLRHLVARVNKELFGAVDARAYQYQELAARLGAALSDPVFPVTGFHVNNVIVPGREQVVAADFDEQVLDLPYRPKFDMNIYIRNSNRGILVNLAYATTVVDHERAERFAREWVAAVRLQVDTDLGGRS